MKRRLYAIPLLALMLAACSDSSPIAPRESLPPDLAITSLRIVSAGTPHPVTGRRVVDSLLVRYVVRNLGDSAAAPATIQFSRNYSVAQFDSIPALGARDSVARTVLIPVTNRFFDFQRGTGDQVFVEMWLYAEGDSTTNNSAWSDTVHMALPVLEVKMQPVTEPRVRVNDPLNLAVTITNHSAIAAARNIQLRHCLWEYDVACWPGNWTAFGSVVLPDIAPGQTHTISYTTTITPTAMEEGYLSYGLQGCVTTRADTAAYRAFGFDSGWVCGTAGEIEVWPDYEACSPPVLSAQPVTLGAPNCGYYPASPGALPWEINRLQWKRYYVFALDAQAGQAFRITGINGPAFYDMSGKPANDVDAAPDRVAFAHSARYYLVVRGWTGTYTVAAEPVP